MANYVCMYVCYENIVIAINSKLFRFFLLLFDVILKGFNINLLKPLKFEFEYQKML